MSRGKMYIAGTLLVLLGAFLGVLAADAGDTLLPDDDTTKVASMADRFVDEDAGVVCYRTRGAHAGIDCLPINETQLGGAETIGQSVPEEGGGR